MQKNPLYQRTLRIMHSASLTESSVKNNDGATVTTSKLLQTPFTFDSIITSPCALVPQNSSLLIELKIFSQTDQTPWLKIAYFEYKKNISFGPQEHNLGKVMTDYFKCAAAATAFQYRVTSCGKTILLGLANTITKAGFTFDIAAAAKLSCPALKLDVPAISQFARGAQEQNRICSPASLTMLLNYYGIKENLDSVKAGVYDTTAKIYGNWIFNTMYAGSYGLEAFATRLDTLEQAYQIVSCAVPLIASIAFEKGELDCSPQPRTDGHLVLIKGFTQNGGVIVNDPAAPTDAQAEIIYNKEQFARAWLQCKEGLVYLINKQEF